MAVSIHAPGRGATVILQLIVECDEVSIHAPGRGATATRTRRASIDARFNSRTREGCDVFNPLEGAIGGVSIHAPGRGATKPFRCMCDDLVGFQFTHPGGVRRYAYLHRACALWFQFTHPGGVRPATLEADTND